MSNRSFRHTLMMAATLLILSFVTPTVAQAACVVGLNPYGDNYLSLRTGPGTGFGEIRRMGPQTQLRILERAGPWRRVRLNNGVQGWAHGRYIGRCGGSAGGVFHVTGLNPFGDNYLSLRSGPGTGYRELRRMGPDTVVRILDRSGPWRYVRLSGGRKGWAHSRYLAPGYP